jgi:uncharacterized Fe-S cluster-containing protein
MEINESNVDIFTKDLKKVAQIDALISETKDLMKPLQSRLKQLKIEKKEVEKELCPTMVKNDFKVAELPNNIGTVEYKVKQAMIPITQKSIKEKMIIFFKEGPASQLSFNSKKSDEKGLELFDYIYGKKNRQFITKEELKFKDSKS